MGIFKDRHGTYYVRKKIPDQLGEAVARLTSSDKRRVSWLKRSLRTKDSRQANVLAKPVLMQIDQLLARAKASLAPLPMRETLSDREIEKMAAYHFASKLAEDEEHRMGDPEG